MNRRTRGFALMAVLWMVVLLTAVVSGSVRTARIEGMAATNRMSLERTRWTAEACASIAIARLDSLARERSEFRVAGPDSLALANHTTCRVTMADPAARLSLDSAGPEALARLDSVLQLAAGLPRESLVTRDGYGRVNVNEATTPVLRTLPGFTAQAADEIVERRKWGRPLRSLEHLIASVSPGAREALLARYGELERSVTFTTASLLATVAGMDRRAVPVSTLELLVVPVGGRVAVVRRRIW